VRDVLAILQRELGRPASDVFGSFELEPLASASFGGSFRYRGGRP